jgi:hypothetical protein
MDMESSSSQDHILVPLPFPSPLQPPRTVGALYLIFDANFETAAESETDRFLANADVPGRATTVTSEKNGHKMQEPSLACAGSAERDYCVGHGDALSRGSPALLD